MKTRDSDEYVTLPVVRDLAVGLDSRLGELKIQQSTADQIAALLNAGHEIRLSACLERRATNVRILCVSVSPVGAKGASA